MPYNIAQERWIKENTTRVVIKLNHNTDSDILSYLEGKSRMTVFKAAIREYMSNHKDEAEER